MIHLHQMKNHSPIPLERGRLLSKHLPDTPETVIATHALNRGTAKVWISGSPIDFSGTVIQLNTRPTELISFGSNPQRLLDLLTAVEGWNCILVDSGIADLVGAMIETNFGNSVHYLEDIYHVTEKPINGFKSKRVRQLTIKDLQLFEAAPEELRSHFWESPRAILSEGIVACAIVDDRIVATALTSSISNRYADVGVYTNSSYRQHGFGTATAALVVNQVVALGLNPVWSTGATNFASLKIAEKLGFKETVRRKYVILEMQAG